jgi:hypothetical protein
MAGQKASRSDVVTEAPDIKKSGTVCSLVVVVRAHDARASRKKEKENRHRRLGGIWAGTSGLMTASIALESFLCTTHPSYGARTSSKTITYMMCCKMDGS